MSFLSPASAPGCVPAVSLTSLERSPVLPRLQPASPIASRSSSAWSSFSTVSKLPGVLSQRLQPARSAGISDPRKLSRRRQGVAVRAAGWHAGSSEDAIARKWGLDGSTPGSASSQAKGAVNKQRKGDTTVIGSSRAGIGPGLLSLLVINLVAFLLDKAAHLPLQILYLQHWAPHWWQFVTNSFFHISWGHISNNLFMLYVFGRIVEDEAGPAALWLTYLVTALGASIASWIFMPANSISLGASGAVFGLFAVAVLMKLSLNFTKLLECAILGQYVVQAVFKELQEVVIRGGTQVAGTQVGHIAHLGGALMGVLLVLVLSKFKAVDDDKPPLPASPRV